MISRGWFPKNLGTFPLSASHVWELFLWIKCFKTLLFFVKDGSDSLVPDGTGWVPPTFYVASSAEARLLSFKTKCIKNKEPSHWPHKASEHDNIKHVSIFVVSMLACWHLHLAQSISWQQTLLFCLIFFPHYFVWSVKSGRHCLEITFTSTHNDMKLP